MTLSMYLSLSIPIFVLWRFGTGGVPPARTRRASSTAFLWRWLSLTVPVLCKGRFRTGGASSGQTCRARSAVLLPRLLLRRGWRWRMMQKTRTFSLGKPRRRWRSRVMLRLRLLATVSVSRPCQGSGPRRLGAAVPQVPRPVRLRRTKPPRGGLPSRRQLLLPCLPRRTRPSIGAPLAMLLLLCLSPRRRLPFGLLPRPRARTVVVSPRLLRER
mmetsp:Transcript_17996/g.38829  ORF Transcript_17996/g.38829 Transcript_17996/m.38829 type:complete len:214 (+) Transcript_17996:1044-1685(+)